MDRGRYGQKGELKLFSARMKICPGEGARDSVWPRGQRGRKMHHESCMSAINLPSEDEEGQTVQIGIQNFLKLSTFMKKVTCQVNTWLLPDHYFLFATAREKHVGTGTVASLVSTTVPVGGGAYRYPGT
jgi:hypothetical protein